MKYWFRITETRNAEDEFAREVIGEQKAKFRLNFKLIFIIQQNAKLPVSSNQKSLLWSAFVVDVVISRYAESKLKPLAQ